MNIQILETQYKGNRLRYFVFGENKILFNTEDLYRILRIKEPVEQTEESLADAILLASSSDTDFAMWLQEQFAQYSDETPVRPSGFKWD
jgi:hypothetical protein